MKTRFKILICLTVFYFISSCTQNKEVDPILQTTTIVQTKFFTEIDKHKWLLGPWHGTVGQINIDETWVKENDSTYSGTCIFTKASDTLSFEKIKLVQTANVLYYIPLVKDQNEGKPINFTMSKNNEFETWFENTKHDFPQKINYIRKKTDSLLVEISGMRDGKVEVQQFPFSRVK